MQTEKKLFLTAQEVSEMLEVSKGHAYKLIRELNFELQSKGYLTISGRVPTDYFRERCYCSGLATERS